MQILISYDDEYGETKVDGPYCSYPEISHAINMLQARGIEGGSLHRIDMVCDFCSAPHVCAIFSVEPGGVLHVDGGNVHIDTGEWAACEICRLLIQGQEPVELLRRSVENGRKIHQELRMLPVVVVAEICAQPHALFWSKYDGSDPEPVISDDDLLGG